ncbi:hypothetical protein NQZ68_012664 [Dissostichus eleginoides]|nr:hypothetical protein NQZ68_012664 [Dissostichus eleginoides]
MHLHCPNMQAGRRGEPLTKKSIITILIGGESQPLLLLLVLQKTAPCSMLQPVLTHGQCIVNLCPEAMSQQLSITAQIPRDSWFDL